MASPRVLRAHVTMIVMCICICVSSASIVLRPLEGTFDGEQFTVAPRVSTPSKGNCGGKDFGYSGQTLLYTETPLTLEYYANPPEPNTTIVGRYYWRVAYAPYLSSGTKFDSNIVTEIPNMPNVTNSTAYNTTVYGVLNSFNFTLPNAECTQCVLQIYSEFYGYGGCWDLEVQKPSPVGLVLGLYRVPTRGEAAAGIIVPLIFMAPIITFLAVILTKKQVRCLDPFARRFNSWFEDYRNERDPTGERCLSLMHLIIVTELLYVLDIIWSAVYASLTNSQAGALAAAVTVIVGVFLLVGLFGARKRSASLLLGYGIIMCLLMFLLATSLFLIILYFANINFYERVKHIDLAPVTAFASVVFICHLVSFILILVTIVWAFQLRNELSIVGYQSGGGSSLDQPLGAEGTL